MCASCEVEYPLTQFSWRKDSRKHRNTCKRCRSLASAAQRYGVTAEFILALRKEQDHSCAICGIHELDVKHRTFIWNPLVIDHDHASGKVRGLLCSHCNILIGNSREEIKTLKRAITYLRKHR